MGASRRCAVHLAPVGIDVSLPAVGLHWSQIVDHYVDVHGNWHNMAEALIRAIRLQNVDPPPLDTVAKGLRRLAGRGQQPGGQYGRWLLRAFGLPPDQQVRLRWMAQYHSRFADLPTAIRREQLLLWERPPATESAEVAWIHVGLASVHHRRGEHAEFTERIAAAHRSVKSGTVASVEVALLRARAASDAGDRAAALAMLDDAEATLGELRVDLDWASYRTRLVGQRAFLRTKLDPSAATLRVTQSWFEDLPADSGVPFVDYRRTAGLAYTTWKLGQVERARRLAEQAGEHAADGGFVRFRAMALNLLARMSEPSEAERLRDRAERLAASVEDVLLQRVSAGFR